MKFRTELTLHGKTATGIPVPAEVLDALGSGKRPRVTVTFNGYAFDTTLGSVDGEATIPVSAATRTAAGVQAGDVLDVEIHPATAPATVAVPDDLAAPLADEPSARAFFDQLSPSQQRGYVDWINQAKRDDTRTRRIEQTLAAMRNRQTRH